MRLANTFDSFGAVTKVLHWSIAFLILGLIALGWYMVDLTYYDKWYHDSLTVHRALGMLVLALGLIKIVWTLFSIRPELPPGMAAWERLSAHGAHVALFLMMVAIPVTGYIISTSAGDGIEVYDWFTIPALFQAGERLRDLAIEFHYYLAYGTLGLVAVHAGAAFKHQLINKDGTLKRML